MGGRCDGHQVAIPPEALVKPMWEGGADDFFESNAWEDELYPLLKKYAWNGGSPAASRSAEAATQRPPN